MTAVDKVVTNDGSAPERPTCRDAMNQQSNDKTLAAMREARDGQGEKFNSIDELFADLNSADERE